MMWAKIQRTGGMETVKCGKSEELDWKQWCCKKEVNEQFNIGTFYVCTIYNHCLCNKKSPRILWMP